MAFSETVRIPGEFPANQNSFKTNKTKPVAGSLEFCLQFLKRAKKRFPLKCKLYSDSRSILRHLHISCVLIVHSGPEEKIRF